MTSTSTNRHFAAAFVLLSLCAVGVYAFLWPEAPFQGNDSRGYMAVAQDMADGRMETLSMRTTGYPILLLLTGSSVEPTRALFFTSLVFHFVAVGMLLVVLLRLGFSHRATAIFALLAALPPFVGSTAMVLTENLSQILLVGAVACVALWLHRSGRAQQGRRSWAWPAAAGLFFGASAIVRPSFQLAGVTTAVVVVLVALLAGKKAPSLRVALAGGALLAGVSVLLLVLYATWSWQRFDYFGLAPGTLGYSLSTKTSKVLERLPEEYAAEREILILGRDANLVERGSSHTGEQFLPGTKPALSEATGLTGLALEDHIVKLNVLLIKKAPLHYLWESLRALPTFFFPTLRDYGQRGERREGQVASRPALPWIAFHFAFVAFFFLQLAVVIGGVALAWTRRFQERSQGHPWSFWRNTLPFPETGTYLLAGGIILYTVLISCGLHHGEARYRAPVDLLILLSCALGLRLWGRLASSGANETPPEKP